MRVRTWVVLLRDRYDEVVGCRIILTSEVLPFLDGKYVVNTSTNLHVNGSYLTIADRCQPLPAKDKFGPMYDWLKYATARGNTTVTGRPCSLYTLDVPTQQTSLALCIDSATGRLPLLLNISIPGCVICCCARERARARASISARRVIMSWRLLCARVPDRSRLYRCRCCTSLFFCF